MHRTASRFVVVVLILMALIGCRGGSLPWVEDSDFGPYVRELDTLSLHHTYDSLIRVDTSQWKAVITVKEHYQKTKQSLWFDRSGVSSDADMLVEILRKELPRHGLDTTAFGIPQIAADLRVVQQLAFDSIGQSINVVLPRLDYLLSRAFVLYTVGQRYGFIRPDKLLNHYSYREEQQTYAQLFDYPVRQPDYQEAINQLTDDDRMEYLEKSHPSGALYERLLDRLGKTDSREDKRRLTANIERCRWQMAQPQMDGRMVLVNLPAQQLWAIGVDSMFSMRICCGSVNHQTPLLHSELSYMQVNPDWLIPMNIVKSDFLHHEGDSAWFARHRYYIVDRSSGDTLRVKEVTADEMKSGKLRIGQKGGAGNSLGRIVFRFKNKFDIYLHDTNMRWAFNNERRTVSHGCIRVEKPFELACFLMGTADEWTLDRLRISMDIKPKSERGLNYLIEHSDSPRPFRLMTYQAITPHVPLYIIYYTVYPNPETGILETWPDIYGYDKLILRELYSLID